MKQKPANQAAVSESGNTAVNSSAKLPPLPTYQSVGGAALQKTPPLDVKQKKRKSKSNKASSVRRRASKAPRQTDLAAQVAELQGQIAALRAAVEGRETSVESQERVQRPRSRASANPQPTPASSPVESSGYSTGPSHSPLHHAVAAQREGGPLPDTAAQQPPSTLDPRLWTLDSGPSTQLAALSEQIAELRTQLASVATAAASAPGPSHSPLHHAVAAQREGGPLPVTSAEQPPSTPLAATPPPSTLDSGLSTRAGAKPMPIYELKETRPVGYQSSDLLDSSSEESEDGFFTGLLDRARMQWLMGDWEALAKLDLEQIQHHPDRAKLALLVSAGLMQSGQAERAKQHLNQAYRWGVPKKLAFSILYSGVRQSLRQATNGKVSSGASLTNGAPGARLGGGVTAALPTPVTSLSSSQVAQIVEEILNAKKNVLSAVQEDLSSVKKQIKNLESRLQKDLMKGLTNVVRQIEAFHGIRDFMGTTESLGAFHGFPISPDLGLYLIQQLEATTYDLIIEFGSGTSTQLIAKSLEVIAKKHPGRAKPMQVAFEHLEEYHQKTLSILQQSGHAQAVDLHHTPLVPYHARDGSVYAYYDCEAQLQALQQRFQNKNDLRIFALVDGPPKSTGLYARYPALPILLKYFKNSHIDLILDDYRRPEEKEVAHKWVEDLQALQVGHVLTEEELDRGACKLSIGAPAQRA